MANVTLGGNAVTVNGSFPKPGDTVSDFTLTGKDLKDVSLKDYAGKLEIAATMLRREPPLLPEVSELDAVRHYTALSQKNFSIDTQFYPLGSCTMKYNPRGANALAMLSEFLAQHPEALAETGQGFLACLYE